MTSYNLQETMDTLMLRIEAGYPLIYIVSHEEGRVMDYLAKIVRMIKQPRTDEAGQTRLNKNKSLFRWQMGMGLQALRNMPAYSDVTGSPKWIELPGIPADATWDAIGNQDVVTALDRVKNAGVLNPDPEVADSVVVCFDIHQYMQTAISGTNNGALVRHMRNLAEELRRYYDLHRQTQSHPYKTVIVVAPSATGLSKELERDLITVDFPLPEENELLATLRLMTTPRSLSQPPILSFPDPVPEKDMEELFGKDQQVRRDAAEYRRRLSSLIAASGRGLTLEDYKLGLNGFAVRSGKLAPGHIQDMLNLKAKAINNDALHYTPNVDVELGGLKRARAWIASRRGAISDESIRAKYHLPQPKGLLLCGVSGGGKSQLAKLIASEMKLSLLRLDVGALFGQYVGESEARAREALRMAEVLSPVVLWMDEIDKAFTGMGGGDGGVAARLFGYFLTWMGEKKDSVFVVATANDFEKLLNDFPEFGRKGRFDEIMWVGLPDAAARKEAFKIYLSRLTNSQDRYLQLDNESVNSLIEASGVVMTPATGERTPLDRFCEFLAANPVSNELTGAEIEYAIVTALYKAYEADQSSASQRSSFTPSMILEAVKEARGKALYLNGTTTAAHLARLSGIVALNKWPHA
jgi:hypothetical protein